MTRAARWLLSHIRDTPGKSTSGLRKLTGLRSAELREAMAALREAGLVEVRLVPEPGREYPARRVWAVAAQ